jgi:hypothetical protein
VAAAFGATLGSTNGDRSTFINTAFNASATTGVASGTNCRIVTCISYWTQLGAAKGPTGVSDSGGSYTRDLQVQNAITGQDVFEVWSRPVTSTQLASGQNVTAAFPAQGTGNVLGGYFVAVHTITGVDLTNGGGVNATGTLTNGSGTTWTVSGTATSTGIAIGGVGTEVAAASTNTASSGTEIYDQRQTTAQQGMVNEYLLAASTGSKTLSGTLTSTSTATTGGVVIYADASSGAAIASTSAASAGMSAALTAPTGLSRPRLRRRPA